MSGAVWGEVANAAIQAGTSWLNSDSQRQTNRVNAKLAREQRSWEEMMSNTAVQRRARDIELAGGNKAAAFVNGGEASTPVVTPARMEAPHFDAPRFNTAALMMQAQMDNLKAQTYNTSADTRQKTIQSDLLEKFGDQSSAQDLQRKTNENSAFAAELRKKTADAEISEKTAKLIDDKMAMAIELLTQQARMGKINADSSEAIAKTLGVAGKDLGPVSRFFLEMMKSFILKGK